MPEVLRSELYYGREFNKFPKHLGFTHRKVTPYWPRANGEVERFMRTVKKVIKAAVMENKVWKQEMYKFLRNYRATPHTSTKIKDIKVDIKSDIKVEHKDNGIEKKGLVLSDIMNI
jgi:hypothetical protein